MLNYIVTVDHARQLKVCLVEINDSSNGEMETNGAIAKIYLVATGC